MLHCGVILRQNWITTEEAEMKDSEIRGILLQAFYDRRDEKAYTPLPEDFGNNFSPDQIIRICEQLKAQGMISGVVEHFLDGSGIVICQITAFGADVVEGTGQSTIGISFVNNSVNISNSTGVVVGNNNQQTVTHAITELARVIESADASKEQKDEAKSLLVKFLAHPLLAAIVGSIGASLL